MYIFAERMCEATQEEVNNVMAQHNITTRPLQSVERLGPQIPINLYIYIYILSQGHTSSRSHRIQQLLSKAQQLKPAR